LAKCEHLQKLAFLVKDTRNFMQICGSSTGPKREICLKLNQNVSYAAGGHALVQIFAQFAGTHRDGRIEGRVVTSDTSWLILKAVQIAQLFKFLE